MGGPKKPMHLRSQQHWRARLTDPWARGATGVAIKRKGKPWLWCGPIHGITFSFWISDPSRELELFSPVTREAGRAGRPHASLQAVKDAVARQGGIEGFANHRRYVLTVAAIYKYQLEL